MIVFASYSYSYRDLMGILWLETCMLVLSTVSYDLKGNR